MKKIFLSLLLAITSIALWAQPGQQPEPPKGQPRFDPQKFQEMVEASLTQAAGLTPDEAKAFFPPYNEMRAKQRDMGKQIGELKKNASGDAKAYAETIQRINQLKVDMAVIEQTFYKRVLKDVPAEKVFKVIKAEDDFHRRMVQRQHDRRPKGPADQPGQGQRKRHNHERP